MFIYSLVLYFIKDLRRTFFTGGLVLISLLVARKHFYIILRLVPWSVTLYMNLILWSQLLYRKVTETVDWILNVVRNKLSRFFQIGLVFCQLIFDAINFFVWDSVHKAIQPANKIYWATLSFHTDTKLHVFLNSLPTKTCAINKALCKWANDLS